jgi:hypothetical protein
VQVSARCVQVTRLSKPDTSRIYDLSLQPPWGSSSGGAWVAGASSLGDVALWDTSTWQEVFSAKASTGSIYSCCALPGCAMLHRRACSRTMRMHKPRLL